MGRIDIDVAVAQHAGLRNRGCRINMQVLRRYSWPTRMVTSTGVGLRSGTIANTDHVADRHAFQSDRGAILDPRGIFEVAAKNQLAWQKAHRSIRTSERSARSGRP